MTDRRLPAEPREPLLELCHTFFERLLLRLPAGTRNLRSLFLVAKACTDLRALLRGHLRPDPTGALDLLVRPPEDLGHGSDDTRSRGPSSGAVARAILASRA